MVAFCKTMNWTRFARLLSAYKDRLDLAVKVCTPVTLSCVVQLTATVCCGQADVLPLARVPGVLPFRARRLFDANIRTRVQLATTTEDDFVSNILEVVSLPPRLLSVPRGDLCSLPAIPGKGRGCIRWQFSCEHVSRCP